MTWELRWFFEGSDFGATHNWIEDRLVRPGKDEKRTDFYLIMSQCDIFSTKWREGKIEAKWRTQEFQDEIAAGIFGNVEYWSKLGWKIEGESGKNRGEGKRKKNKIEKYLEDEPTAPWVAVDKERIQWRVQQTSDREWTAVDRKRNGFLVELTDITMRGQKWWSLGFDLFPEKDQMIRDLLSSGVLWFFEGYPGPSLDYDNSYGYPKWVSLL